MKVVIKKRKSKRRRLNEQKIAPRCQPRDVKTPFASFHCWAQWYFISPYGSGNDEEQAKKLLFDKNNAPLYSPENLFLSAVKGLKSKLGGVGDRLFLLFKPGVFGGAGSGMKPGELGGSAYTKCKSKGGCLYKVGYFHIRGLLDEVKAGKKISDLIFLNKAKIVYSDGTSISLHAAMAKQLDLINKALNSKILNGPQRFVNFVSRFPGMKGFDKAKLCLNRDSSLSFGRCSHGGGAGKTLAPPIEKGQEKGLQVQPMQKRKQAGSQKQKAFNAQCEIKPKEGSFLNIRSEPNTSSKILGKMDRDELAALSFYPKAKTTGENIKGNRIWYKIEHLTENGYIKGWISGYYTKCKEY